MIIVALFASLAFAGCIQGDSIGHGIYSIYQDRDIECFMRTGPQFDTISDNKWPLWCVSNGDEYVDDEVCFFVFNGPKNHVYRAEDFPAECWTGAV